MSDDENKYRNQNTDEIVDEPNLEPSNTMNINGVETPVDQVFDDAMVRAEQRRNAETANPKAEREKRTADTLNSVGKDVGSAALQAKTGVPAPVADAAADKVAENPAVKHGVNKLAKNKTVQKLAGKVAPVAGKVGAALSAANAAKTGGKGKGAATGAKTSSASESSLENVGKGSKNNNPSMNPLKGGGLLSGSETENEEVSDDVAESAGVKATGTKALIRLIMKHPWILFILGFVLILFITIIIVIVVMMDEEYAGNYAVVYKCLNETMVIESGPYAGEYSFEDYVAGVVQSQIKDYDNVGEETLKALSVVVRNYTIFNTDECKNTVVNDENFQTFEPPSEKILGITRQPLIEGKVLTDASSQLINVEYSTFPGLGEDSSVDGMPGCTPLECEEGECSTTIYRYPFGTETGFEFTISEKREDGADWGVGSLEEQTGHCYGFSILGSMYLEETFKYSDDFILKYFFESYTKSLDGTDLGTLDPGVFTALSSAMEVQQNAEGPGRPYFYEGNKYVHTYQVDGVSKFGNCTWYAYGRAKQILYQVHASGEITDEQLKQKLNILQSIGGNGNQWYPSNTSLGSAGFPYGSTPRIGAIVGWSGGTYGHVSIVETVNADGSFYTSDGGRGFSNPQGYGYVHVRNNSANGQTVQGFIYII